MLIKLLWEDERPEISVADVKFVSKELPPEQVRAEAEAIVTEIYRIWDDINELWVRWMNVDIKEGLSFLEDDEADRDLELEKRITAAAAAGEISGLADMMEEFGKKRVLSKAIYAIHQGQDSTRLRAQEAKISGFVQYSDTYPLQLIRAETRQYLAHIREKESWLQNVYDEYLKN